MNDKEVKDPFAHLKRQANDRADRQWPEFALALPGYGHPGKRSAPNRSNSSRAQLEPGFNGLSFQVIRRNPRAYELYREAASAFTTAQATPNHRRRRKHRRTRRDTSRTPRSLYDRLQRLDKLVLVRRVRALEQELETERQQRGLAYNQQAVLAGLLRMETEITYLRAEGSG